MVVPVLTLIGVLAIVRAVAAPFRGDITADVQSWTLGQYVLVIVAGLAISAAALATSIAALLVHDLDPAVRVTAVAVAVSHTVALPVMLFRISWTYFSTTGPRSPGGSDSASSSRLRAT
jgi:hypothetical protein